MTAARPQSNNNFSPPASIRTDGPYLRVSAGGPAPEPRTTIFKTAADGDDGGVCPAPGNEITRRINNAPTCSFMLFGKVQRSLAPFLYIQDDRNANADNGRRGSSHRGVAIQAAPEIPGGDRAIRMPAFGELLDLLRLGKLTQPIGFFDRRADAEVSRRQNVGTAQSEDQKHVGSPNADAFNAREVFDDIVIGHVHKPTEVELARERPFREVADVFRFLPG